MFNDAVQSIVDYVSRFISDRRWGGMETSIWIKQSALYYNSGKLTSKTGQRFPVLSREQKAEVDAIYGKYKKQLNYNYSYKLHEMTSAIRGKFEPEIVPSSLLFARLRDRMNSHIYMSGWRDKNFFDLLELCGHFPKVILRNISGFFYDDAYTLLSVAEAEKILSKHGEYIVKPSLDSSGGNGVTLYTSPQSIASIVSAHKSDFIIQERLNQHKDFAALNPSSVNIVRIMSMFIEDKPEFLMAALRVGAPNAITDWSPTEEGKGNMVIGVDSDGLLMDKGVYKNGHWGDHAPSGISLGGYKLPNFDGMVNMVLKCHEITPFFKLIAWDITVDETGEPCIMEYNVERPGVIYYQWTNGPLFGYDRQRIHYVIDRLAGLK